MEETQVFQDLNDKLKHYFEGKIVRKDLTKIVKESANVPVYVLEYLLGAYCSQQEDMIEEGVQRVKNILSENYVHPYEAQKILSKLQEYGSYSIIDVVSVEFKYKQNMYVASFSNLGIKDIPIDPEYPQKYERLLGGNLWCQIRLEYEFDEADRRFNPLKIADLMPIQLPNIDIDEIFMNRKNFTKDEWIDVILRSCGMEPTQFEDRVKWLLIARLIPLAENNFNLCELGPRGTGKSHVYREISPNSILVSGGKTTVANLFYNMNTKQIGLVGMWDCVAFDEVAGIKFKDNDGITIMKDFMASGSFSRGKEEKNANASMVFVGNINQSVESLLKTSSLFDPFPPEMGNDTAFFDRMHCYIPGWEIPKYRREFFTDEFGFITDFLAEFLREMRKHSCSDSYHKFFKLGRNLNQRDSKAIDKMVSGLVKIIYPNEEYDKEDIREILEFALESRRRVKEQLKRIGGMEFFDVDFSYIDLEENREHYVGVLEQASTSLIPEGTNKPGHLYTVGHSISPDKIGVYKIETEKMKGSGKFTPAGLGSNTEIKEAVNKAFKYLKSNYKNVSGNISTKHYDYLMEVHDLNGVGHTKDLTLAAFVGLCSCALDKPLLPSIAIIGNLSIGGTIKKVDNLAEILQVCADAGAKKLLIPMVNVADIATVPPEITAKLDWMFYATAEEAVFKALGVS